MTASVSGKPFKFDFLGNSLRFKLHGNPVSVNGRNSIASYQINSLPPVGGRIVVSSDQLVFSFDIATEFQATEQPYRVAYYASTYTAKIRDEVKKKIADNYYIRQLYDVSVSDDLKLTFTSKQYGTEAAVMTFSNGGATLLSQIQGVQRVLKENYQLFSQLEVRRYANGTFGNVRTPEIYIHLNGYNVAELPLDILRAYFDKVDIPAENETFMAHKLKAATIKCTLSYAEVQGQTPQVQVIKTTQQYIFAQGRIDPYCQMLNLPDWSTEMGKDVALSDYNDIRNYGSANALTLQSFLQMPQYAYFMLFSTSHNESYQKYLAINVDILRKDGTRQTMNKGSLTIPNFNIVRIPLSVSALGISTPSTILQYTVTASTSSGCKWWRTFLVQQQPFFAKTFLFQNRYGVLESIFIDNEIKESDTEGDEIVRDGELAIDITDTATIYTARCGYKDVWEKELVASAMQSRWNYKMVDGRAVPIVILPDSLTLFDEDEDLSSVEFKYRFNDSRIEEVVLDPSVVVVWDDTSHWNDAVRRDVESEISEISTPSI